MHVFQGHMPPPTSPVLGNGGSTTPVTPGSPHPVSPRAGNVLTPGASSNSNMTLGAAGGGGLFNGASGRAGDGSSGLPVWFKKLAAGSMYPNHGAGSSRAPAAVTPQKGSQPERKLVRWTNPAAAAASKMLPPWGTSSAGSSRYAAQPQKLLSFTMPPPSPAIGSGEAGDPARLLAGIQISSAASANRAPAAAYTPLAGAPGASSSFGAAAAASSSSLSRLRAPAMALGLRLGLGQSSGGGGGPRASSPAPAARGNGGGPRASVPAPVAVARRNGGGQGDEFAFAWAGEVSMDVTEEEELELTLGNSMTRKDGA